MANFAGTCTSDNKGLLLLMLSEKITYSHIDSIYLIKKIQLKQLHCEYYYFNLK